MNSDESESEQEMKSVAIQSTKEKRKEKPVTAIDSSDEKGKKRTKRRSVEERIADDADDKDPPMEITSLILIVHETLLAVTKNEDEYNEAAIKMKLFEDSKEQMTFFYNATNGLDRSRTAKEKFHRERWANFKNHVNTSMANALIKIPGNKKAAKKALKSGTSK